MFLTLPRSPDLAHLRDEAKSLKKRTAAGEADAIAFVDFHRGPSAEPIKLADVQFALARAYGFKSWQRLKAFVEVQPHTPLKRGNRLLQELFGDNWALLQELYERRNELPADDIFIAAGLGNATAVEALLAADPSLAKRPGGPKQTQAITYAAHGRFYLLDESYRSRQQQIVQLLLANGADPNSSAPPAKGDGRLSALYGCCRQTGNPVVAKMLLDAGANPHDGESLYHSSELRDTTCLELVLAAGIPDEHRDYCLVRALDAENPAAVAVYLKYGTNPNQLHWALFRDRSLEVIQLLVQHGADVNALCSKHWLLGRIEGLTPVQVAERAGRNDIVKYLLEQGATETRGPEDYLISACWREDEPAVLANRHAQLLPRDHGNVATAARSGRLKVVQLMLDSGFDIEARSDDIDATPLNYAATTGDIGMVDFLLARGARQGPTDKHGFTPIRTAVFCAAHYNSGSGNYAKVVRSLLAAGGEIPPDSLPLALEYHLDDIAEVLKEHSK